MNNINRNNVDGFDIFNHFQLQYDITIADDCYIAPFQAKKLVTLLSRKPPSPSRRSNPSYIKKSVKVSSESMQNPKLVGDLIFSFGSLKHRHDKRHYQFSDKDVEEIVKTGRIPSIKSLMALASRMEEDASAPKNAVLQNPSSDSLEDEEDQTQTIQEIENAQSPKQEGSLIYDPSMVDQTFLTGIHITQLPNQQEFDLNDELSSNYDTQLPRTILGSVRALRVALKNPGVLRRAAESTLAVKGVFLRA